MNDKAAKELNVNLDALLDGTLDDLADMPEFKPYPAGSHKVILHMAQKKINNHPAIEIKLTAIETLELPANSDAAPLEKGAETSVLYMLDNEMGQGKFKEIMRVASEKFGAKTNRELMKELQGCEAAVVTELRKNKEKTKEFTDIVEIVLI